MSRIADRAIEVPPQVEVKLHSRGVAIKGAFGTKVLNLPSEVEITQKENQIFTKSKIPALAGTYNALITNLIEGVSKGHRLTLVLEGSGYEVELENEKRLKFTLAKIESDYIQVPPGIKAKVENNRKITVEGVDNQAVGELAAKIENLSPPSIYHEKKGIYLEGKKYRTKKRKVGK
ncbi:MAG: 50S ribosomal protein L6 [Mycoplasmataceae bacterium RC_NB112A]|nr:MAG: 50S ribosomal protein L6 [Mycoplasmataceae bacterium RC_NB112A]KLL01882.1 MAG: 50S ribosomal protein L6 [Mycoplasmataceae bacterium RC_NB112A]